MSARSPRPRKENAIERDEVTSKRELAGPEGEKKKEASRKPEDHKPNKNQSQQAQGAKEKPSEKESRARGNSELRKNGTA